MSAVPPSVIGRYELQKSLGDGGMGTVYLARDPIIERAVAIKRIRRGIDSPEIRERFMREARSAGRLRHPNIVTIFDVGEHDGEPFIAMEYVPGDPLADMIRRRVPLSLVRRLQIIEDLCDGLQYAHDAGIVHRDIKPANVMVGEDGVVKILDFGIARVGAAGLTKGSIGTLNYMAPEQLEGKPIDRRVDVFSIGALLYELLCFRRAFPGDLADGVLAKILTGEPEPLEAVVPSVHPSLVAIVSRCLEKKPHRRYPDCLTLAKTIAMVRKELGDSDPASGEATLLGGGSRQPRRSAANKNAEEPPPIVGESRNRAAQNHLERPRSAITTVVAFVAVLLAALSLWIGRAPRTALGGPASSTPPSAEIPTQKDQTQRLSPNTVTTRPGLPTEPFKTDDRRIETSSSRGSETTTGPGVASTRSSVNAPEAPPAAGATKVSGGVPATAPPSMNGPTSLDRSGFPAPSSASMVPGTLPSGRAEPTNESRSTRPLPGQALLFTDPNRRFSVEFPKEWSWTIVEGSGAPMVTFVHPQKTAAVVIEEVHIGRRMQAEDIIQEFADAEVGALKENQPMTSQVAARVAVQSERRVVQIDYRRPGVSAKLAGQRVRQFSFPLQGSLYRITCAALTSQFAAYEGTFQWIVESFKPADPTEVR